MPLTATAIRNAKAHRKPYKLADGEGMYLPGQPGRRALLAPQISRRGQGEAAQPWRVPEGVACGGARPPR
jgi:hypothetical protein